MKDKLVLYYKPTCPYSQKVLGFMDARGIQIEMRNTIEDPNRLDLIKIGGKQQVPCLVIGGKALYESDDIIKWLEQNWKTYGR